MKWSLDQSFEKVPGKSLGDILHYLETPNDWSVEYLEPSEESQVQSPSIWIHPKKFRILRDQGDALEERLRSLLAKEGLL